MTGEEASYDVYVKVGVDRLGDDDFGTAVAHFVSRDNAVALRRKLETQGEIVRVEKSVVRLSEVGKDAWFSDHEPPPPRSYEDALTGALTKPANEESSEEDHDGAWWIRLLGG